VNQSVVSSFLLSYRLSLRWSSLIFIQVVFARLCNCDIVSGLESISMPHQLIQKLGSITRMFFLSDDGRLTIEVHAPKSRTVSTLSLHEISEDSRQLFSKGRIIDTQVAAGVTLVLLFSVPGLGLTFRSGFGIAAATFLGIALIMAFWTWKAFQSLRAEAFDFHVYSQRNSGPDAFVLWTNLPDPESFTAFVTTLRTSILRFKPRTDTNSGNDLVAVLEDLERLYSKGVLAEPEFQSAKNRVLTEQFQRPQVGFRAN